MLSKCFASNGSVFKGWFLKLNKDTILAYDYMSFSLMRGNNPRTPFITPFYQDSDPSLQGHHFTL